jgi:hypothetical protein
MAALERLIASNPAAFEGTELDVEANQRKMEKLCERSGGPSRRRSCSAPRGGDLVLGHGEDVLRQHRDVGVLADRQRALRLLLERRVGGVDRVGLQRLFAVHPLVG